MTAKLDYIWKLREVMATRGLFQTTHLRPRLAERGIHLSDSQVYRLVTDKPERLNLKIFMALLDILGCRMEDLIQPVAVPAAKTKKKAAGQSSEPGTRDRRVPAQTGADRSRFLARDRLASLPGAADSAASLPRLSPPSSRPPSRAWARRRHGRGHAGRSVPGPATTSRRCADR